MRTVILLLLLASQVMAHQPRLTEGATVKVENPEVSQAFYNELTGLPHIYLIDSPHDFTLYVGILVPESVNPHGRFGAELFQGKKLLARLSAGDSGWKKYYEPFAGDNYLRGPEFKRRVLAGRYAVKVFNQKNRGKYVLAVGEKENWSPQSLVSALLILPKLKQEFFKTNPWTLLPTYLGVVYLLLLALLILLIFCAVRSCFRKI